MTTYEKLSKQITSLQWELMEIENYSEEAYQLLEKLIDELDYQAEELIMFDLQNLCNEHDNEITLTTNFSEAIFLDSKGQLLDGEFDYGSRGLDHNILRTKTITWIDLHNGGLVRLVPETKTALISKNQSLTIIQENLIKRNCYEIETYI